jgi:hypothetical protein
MDLKFIETYIPPFREYSSWGDYGKRTRHPVGDFPREQLKEMNRLFREEYNTDIQILDVLRQHYRLVRDNSTETSAILFNAYSELRNHLSQMIAIYS